MSKKSSIQRRVFPALAACYPRAFSLENPVPLKIGVFSELLEEFPALHPRDLAITLNWYCSRKAYLLASHHRSAARHNLAGEIEGEIGHKAAKSARRLYRKRMGWAADYWPCDVRRAAA